MPIWGQVELLCRSIREEGRKLAEEILDKARQDADKAIRNAIRDADRDRQGILLSHKSRAVSEAGQMVDTAELEARKRMMAFRSQMIQDVTKALQDRLIRFRDEPGYGDFLVSAFQESMDHLSEPHLIVELSRMDADAIGSRFQEAANACTVSIEIRHAEELGGGIRVIAADGKRMVDNTLWGRMSRWENEIRQEIWRSIVELSPTPE